MVQRSVGLLARLVHNAQRICVAQRHINVACTTTATAYACVRHAANYKLLHENVMVTAVDRQGIAAHLLSLPYASALKCSVCARMNTAHVGRKRVTERTSPNTSRWHSTCKCRRDSMGYRSHCPQRFASAPCSLTQDDTHGAAYSKSLRGIAVHYIPKYRTEPQGRRQARACGLKPWCCLVAVQGGANACWWHQTCRSRVGAVGPSGR